MIRDIYSAVVLTTAHCHQLVQMEALCFSTPWSLAMLQSELENPAAFYVGFEDKSGALAAYGGIQIAADEGYITNIAALPSLRRQGLGRRVLALLLDKALCHSVRRVSLEVRVSNTAARRLYEQFGFSTEGRRPAYYDEPREDALIMNLYLGTARK